jgi:hypothetical protein
MTRRARATPPSIPPGPTDQERIVWRLVAEAQAQRALIVGNSDMNDVKALGLLGLDGAVVAGLTASRAGLPALWWVAIIALAVCVPFFLFTILRSRFFLGPRLAALYAQYIDGGALQAGVRLLTELDKDMSRTREGEAAKELALTVGLYLFVLGALFTAAFLARMAVVR